MSFTNLIPERAKREIADRAKLTGRTYEEELEVLAGTGPARDHAEPGMLARVLDVYNAIEAAGDQGMTDSELGELLDASRTIVFFCRRELQKEEASIMDSGARRDGPWGPEEAWVLTQHGRELLA